MNFKELKKGYPVYLLNKDSLDYFQGKVTQDATPPRMNTTFGQPMVVDVSIESNGQIKIWTLPSEQSVAEMQSDSNSVIATDKSVLVTILKSIQNECETYLEQVDSQKQKLNKAKKLSAELDIVYKQQQQTEERFVKLEESINGINKQLSSTENTLSQILKAVNNGH